MKENLRPANLMIAAVLAAFCFLPMPGSANAQSREPGAPEHSEKGTLIKSGGFSYRIEPLPSWVGSINEEAKDHPQNAALYFAFIDEQVRADKNSTEYFRHSMRVVSAPAGLAPAAQVLAEFDPAYQSLAFHRLGIWRGNRFIDKLNKAAISMLHRETQLEYRIYDGQVTASAMLDDVRVGDRVEYAYTIRGANPVFNGKLVYTTWLMAETGPVAQYRLRVLSSPERHIKYTAGPDVVITKGEKGGLHEVTFTRLNVPQFNFDPNTTASAYLADQVHLSEFSDWGEVANWGAKLFADALSSPAPAVHQRAEAIRRSAHNQEERLRMALDFVQNEVRYFGLEMGANSHHPAAPVKVIEQRFGDCKDKASLLVGLLRDLDIEADPVLVSSRLRGQVDSVLASPLAFDHVIVRAKLNGQTYWLDGTRTLQTGTLLDRQARGLDKGLVLGKGSVALDVLPGYATEARISVEETFRITKFVNDPTLESRITYFGDLAEYLRHAVSTQPLSQLEKEFSSDYARYYPGIKSLAALKLVEVPGRNAITVVQQFEVPKFWTLQDSRYLLSEVGLWAVLQAVRHPDEVARRLPLKLALPGIHRHTIYIEYPEDVSTTSSSSRFDDGDRNFAFNVTYDNYPRSTKISASMNVLKDAIAVSDWPSYTERLQKLKSRFVVSISAPSIRLDQMERLKKDLKEADEDERAGKLRDKIRTKAQYSAYFRSITLTAQLNSGHLNPFLRAQTLRQRGVQYDHLGLVNAAAGDFEESIRLAPADPKSYVDAAANAFARMDDALATQYLDKALELSPSDPSPYDVKVFTNYFNGNYAAARENTLKLLNDPAEAEKSYHTLWLYLVARRLGEDGSTAARPYLPAGPAPTWPYPLLQLFMGTGNFEQALQAAKNDTRDPSRLCELYYYAGEKALIDGDKITAREYFRKSVDTGVVEFNEYNMARRRLNLSGIR